MTYLNPTPAEQEQTKILTCKACTLADYMKTCKICTFKAGLENKTKESKMNTSELNLYCLADIETFLHEGRISQVQYEAYLWVWENSATRLSSSIATPSTKLESLDSDVQKEIDVIMTQMGYKYENGKIIHKAK